jgi:hypothetical protein
LDKGIVESVEFPPLLIMKNSPLTTILLALLAISAVLSLVFCWSYIRKSRDLRTLQFQVSQINGRSAAINQLMNDVMEYSKRNHEIDKILEPYGLTTNKPASK